MLVKGAPGGYVIFLVAFRWIIYICYSGLSYWHCGSHKFAPVPVIYSLIIRVKADLFQRIAKMHWSADCLKNSWGESHMNQHGLKMVWVYRTITTIDNHGLSSTFYALCFSFLRTYIYLMWPISVSHPVCYLDSSLGLAGGKHYQKITISVFRVVLQNLAIPGYFPYILFYHYILSLLPSG